MRFAHLKMHHGFERMRLRGLSGERDEFHLAAIVQNLKTMALRLLGPPTGRMCPSIAKRAWPLLANAASFGLLWAYRQGDANVRSAWISTRNDVLGNLAVLLAALGVFGTGTGWPDCHRGNDHGRAGRSRWDPYHSPSGR